MNQTDLTRDKHVTREVNHLFWRAMLHTPRYFWPTWLYLPAFYLMNVYIPLQAAYGIQAIITKDYAQIGHHAILILWSTAIGQATYSVATWAFNRNGIYGGTYVQRQLFANYLDKDYEFFGNQYIGALGSQAARIRDAFTDYNRLSLFEIPRSLVIVLASLVFCQKYYFCSFLVEV